MRTTCQRHRGIYPRFCWQWIVDPSAGIEFAVERKDDRYLVPQIISSQGWASKLDMDVIKRHARQTAYDERWMILQIQ